MTKGSSGLTAQLKGLISLFLIAALVYGWFLATGVRNIEEARKYFQEWSQYIDSCGVANLEWNCDRPMPDRDYSNDPLGDGSAGSNGGTDSGGGNTQGTGTSGSTDSGSSQGSADGSGGNSKLSSAQQLNQQLNTLQVAAPAKVAYKRSEWKHWTGTPCDARKLTLIRDGNDVKVQKTATTCKLLSGSWNTVYDSPTKTETDPGNLDIDHTIPLSYAASHGGQPWDAKRKETFANDLSHLKAVSAKENRSKGDKGPGEYMPPNRAYWCTYSTVWVKTASKYNLSISAADKAALQKGLATCSA